MNAKVLVSLFVLAIGGCKSTCCTSTRVFNDSGWTKKWLTVGHFTTENPVDDKLIGTYLRKELTKRGFGVYDYSPYVLTGAIHVNPTFETVRKARIVLKNDKVLIVWHFNYCHSTREEFARDLAQRIHSQFNLSNSDDD